MTTTNLNIPHNPKIEDCILFNRIETLKIQEDSIRIPINDFYDQTDIPTYITVINNWFKEWSSYKKLANVDSQSICPVLATVPILKEKLYLLLKCFSFYKLEQYQDADLYLNQYLNLGVYENSENESLIEFPAVDKHIKQLLTEKAM